jgi:hypothetical protein
MNASRTTEIATRAEGKKEPVVSTPKVGSNGKKTPTTTGKGRTGNTTKDGKADGVPRNPKTV